MTSADRLVLVTGAAGKVGRNAIPQLLAQGWRVRALCHNRTIEPAPGLEVTRGAIEDRAVVRAAMAGVTHVVHLATCKEIPDLIMDVTVKGLFWLLEEARLSSTFQQFVLMGGDAAVGHSFYPRDAPVTEATPHRAYPGCYALSKVLEEVMLEQSVAQYGLNGCCLRAAWIMEKDDFRYTLSFGEDVFGGPRWRDLVGAEKADDYLAGGLVASMLDVTGAPALRNFVHVDDVVSAVMAALDNPAAAGRTFNICMDQPVDYGLVRRYLEKSRGIESVPVATDQHSVWLDNARAREVLRWRPSYDTLRLVDDAWNHQPGPGDERLVYYPG